MLEDFECPRWVLNNYFLWGFQWQILWLWWRFLTKRMIIWFLGSETSSSSLWRGQALWKIEDLWGSLNWLGTSFSVINLNWLLREKINLFVNPSIQWLLIIERFHDRVLFHLIFWGQLSKWLVSKMYRRLFLILYSDNLLNFWWDGADRLHKLLILYHWVSSNVKASQNLDELMRQNLMAHPLEISLNA